ncbi:MAG TPA: dihydrofolate reductase [Jiangellaceae bacterium]
MTVTIIAAIARNGVIGLGSDLPWRLPGDLPRLKAMTVGHVVVMGRRTYDSIGRPLPDRATVVVTRSRDWSPGTAADVHVAHSVPDALALAAKLDDEIFILGGAEIYRQTLSAADRMEITEVHAEPDGDTYFPDVDWSQWRETARVRNDGFDYVTYLRTH